MIIFERAYGEAQPVRVEQMHGNTFNGEDGAHQFVITGVPTGTVTAYMMRADGTACTVDGTNADGTATVTLNQDCYNVPGRFTFSIFVGDTGARVCVYACVGTVYRTRTETIIDSGDVVPSLDDVISKQAELAQDVADASSAVTSAQNAVSYLAPVFSTIKTYKVGEYVTKDGALYICTTAVDTAGAWDAANWQAVTFGGEVTGLNSAINASLLVQTFNQNSSAQSLYISSITDGIVDFANSNNYRTLWKMPVNGANCIKFSGMCGIPNRTAPVFCFLDSNEMAIMDSILYATGKTTYTDHVIVVPENAVAFTVSFRITDISTFNVDLLRVDNYNPASIWAYNGDTLEDKVQSFLNTAPEGTKLDLRGEKVTITKRFTKSQNTRLAYCIISNGTFEIRPYVGGWLDIGANYGYRSPMFENCVFTGGGTIFYNSSYNFKAVGCIFDNCQIINGTYIQACELIGCNVMNESKCLIECQYSFAVMMTDCCFEAGNYGVFKGTGDTTGARASMESGEFTNCIFEGFTNSVFVTDGIVADFTNCYVEKVPYLVNDTNAYKDVCYIRINGGTIDNTRAENTYSIITQATYPSIIVTNLNFKGSPTRYLSNAENRRRQITSSNQNEKYLFGANGGKNEIIKNDNRFSLGANDSCSFATNRTSMTSQPQAFLVLVSEWGFNPDTVRTKISLLTLNYTAGTGYTVTETDIVANSAITTTIDWTASADSYDGLVTLTGTASGRCALSVINLGATMSGMIV